MKRQEKIKTVEALNQAFQSNPHLVLANFKGLTVNQASELRRKIGSAGGTYRVVPNRLAKRAAAGTAVENLADKFQGPCAVALHDSDPVALAKALSDFAKENPQIELQAGIVDAKDVIDAAGVKQLASLPGLPELRAQLLALIQTPATTLVRLIATPASQLARVVEARREALEGAPEG